MPDAHGSRPGSSRARGSTRPTAASGRRNRDGGALRHPPRRPASNRRQSVGAGEAAGREARPGWGRASRVCLRGAMAVILVSFRAWCECLHLGRNFRGRFSSHRTCSVWEAHDRHEPQAQVSPVRRWARENALAHSPLWEAVFSLRAVADPTASSLHEPGSSRPARDSTASTSTPCLRSGRLRRRPRLSHPAAGLKQAAVRRGAAPRPGDATGADPARPAGDLGGHAPAGLQSLYRRPGSGIDKLVRLVGAYWERALATTGPGSGSSSRATSSIAHVRSQPAVRWPYSMTSTSARPGQRRVVIGVREDTYHQEGRERPGPS